MATDDKARDNAAAVLSVVDNLLKLLVTKNVISSQEETIVAQGGGNAPEGAGKTAEAIAASLRILREWVGNNGSA